MSLFEARFRVLGEEDRRVGEQELDRSDILSMSEDDDEETEDTLPRRLSQINVEEYGEYRAVRAREAWSRKDGLDFDLRDGTGRFSILGDSVGEELVDDEGTPSCLGCSALALIPKVAMSSTNEGSVVISRLKGTRRFMHTAGEASGLHS